MQANNMKSKQNNTHTALKSALAIENVMQTPKLVKVIVSAGIGSVKDKKRLALIEDRLTRITGQKMSTTKAKKSMAAFKVREGDAAGYVATLRGERMNSFLDKLVDIALPRMKDFRGLSKRAVDNMGNITIGIKEHTIFPETSDEDIKDIFGFGVTVVTTAKDKKSAVAFFEHLGIPFSKTETAKKGSK